MSDVTVEQKYVVLALRTVGGSQYFQKLISCSYSSITRWIENLTYGTEIELCFFPIDMLNSRDTMDKSHESVKTVIMNNYKTMQEFQNEVDELVEQLEIKVKKEAEDDEDA